MSESIDLLTVGNDILEKITSPSTLMIGFWGLVVIIIFISLLLIVHWKEYGENLTGGLLIYIIYGVGIFVLLGNVYQSIIRIL